MAVLIARVASARPVPVPASVPVPAPAPVPVPGRLPAPPSRPRSPVQPRPAGLVVALPVRPPVASCSEVHRRRRLATLVVAGLFVAAVVVGLGALRAAAVDDAVPGRTVVVEVHRGETLWELAERVAPRSPRLAVVERIRQLNGMNGSTIHPGQPLVVPDGS